MHLGKISHVFNSHTKQSPAVVDGKTIEEVDDYVYLRKKIAREITSRGQKKDCAWLDGFWKSL